MFRFVYLVLQFNKCNARGLFALLFLSFLTACNTQEDVSEVGPENPADPPAISPVTQATQATGKEAGSSNRHPVDNKGTWESEEVNSAVGHQLHVIGDFVTQQNKVDRARLAKVASPDFHSTKLRPQTLNEVFADSAFTVRRQANESTQQKQFSGASGLADALLEITEWLGDTSTRHYKYKTFRVELDKDIATTTSVFQLAGTSSQKAVQQKSTWTCRWQRQKIGEPLLVSIEVTDYEETDGKLESGPMFADCTVSALGKTESYQQHLVHGVDHWLSRIEGRYGINESGLSGMTIGDVNGDGLEDMFIAQPGGLPNLLYVQQQDGTFIDDSAEAGLNWLDHTESALFVDLDNDGDQDLVTTRVIGTVFLENDGTGRFSNKRFILSPEGNAYCLSAADYDNDGDLDIFVGCYRTYLDRGVESGTSALMSGLLRVPNPYHDANNGARNMLLENLGNWTFRDVAKRMGLDVNGRRFSQACSWEDFDNDGDVDLYVANDYGRNSLYRNDGEKFTDIAAEAGVEDLSAGMSVSWGDYNNDGWMDLYISNMFSAAGGRVAFQRRFLSDADQSDRSGFQRHARGNSLFMNTGDGRFSDVSVQAGVTLGRWAWSSQFVDLNNDTWDDLVVANGFLTREDSGDL